MSGKQQRQQAITRLIASGKVTSQPQIQEMLADKGIDATQATISRDLEELGAVKVRVAGGESRYAIPDYEPERVAPTDQLRRVMGEWVAEVSVSGNLVVLRTPPGCAHVVASALDRSGDPALLGTVAGDDTILCVAAESTGGKALAASLMSLAGLTRPAAASSSRTGQRTPRGPAGRATSRSTGRSVKGSHSRAR